MELPLAVAALSLSGALVAVANLADVRPTFLALVYLANALAFAAFLAVAF